MPKKIKTVHYEVTYGKPFSGDFQRIRIHVDKSGKDFSNDRNETTCASMRAAERFARSVTKGRYSPTILKVTHEEI